MIFLIIELVFSVSARLPMVLGMWYAMQIPKKGSRPIAAHLKNKELLSVIMIMGLQYWDYAQWSTYAQMCIDIYI